jgi:alkaline phosphatase
MTFKISHIPKIHTLLAITVAMLTGCSGQKQVAEPVVVEDTKPLNIILLIGDGMGLSQISILHQEQDNLSSFSRFNHIGLINCASGSHKITDSAAGATAFATGIKTYNGAIGVGIDSIAVLTILEIFEDKQYSTGLVSTSAITHATPASFYAHTISRENEVDIADQLLNSGVDFFAGGGRKFFQSLFSEEPAKDWIIDTSDYFQFALDMPAGKKFGYLLANEGMPKMSEGRGSFCTDASRIGIDHLKKNKKGYFMMIEGSQIDWGGHAEDYEYVKTEMEDFNEVVNMVMDYAEKDGNTLVIVTADHETGGLSLSAERYLNEEGNTRYNYDSIQGYFSTSSHTAALIPVFAYGPGAENFTGIYQNTGIYDRILKLMH